MGTIDVLVAGAGPTGVTLATVLARSGVGVAVLDSAEGPRRESSRATTIHAATLEQLDRLGGAGEEIAGRAARAPTSSLWSGTRRLAQVHWDRIPSRYAFMANLPQSETESAIRTRLDDAGGEVRWGHTVTGIERAGDVVDVRVDAGGRPAELRARFLVGCDGARSAVRRALGIELRGATHEERFLLADVDLDTDLDARQTHVFVSTAGMIGVMPLPGGGFRLNGTLADDEELTPAALAGLVARRARRRLAVTRVDWASDYRTHSRLADRYRVGAVFLAGDAAHLNSPVGGQGMNTGIQDAVNLGWKLSEVVRGRADDKLLDTYEAERRPVAARVLRAAETSTRMITARNPVERRLRNTAMWIGHRLPPVQRVLAVEPSGVLQHYGRGEPDAGGSKLVGARLPDVALGPPRGGRLHDLVGRLDHHLLTVDASAVAAERWTSCASAHGLAAHHIGSVVPGEGHVADPEGRVRHALGVRPGQALLVRPDGFVGWAGSEPDDLAVHLRRTGRQPAEAGRGPRPMRG